MLKTEVRYTDLTKQSGRSQDANNIVFPKINTQVINKILKDDYEEKGNVTLQENNKKK